MVEAFQALRAPLAPTSGAALDRGTTARRSGPGRRRASLAGHEADLSMGRPTYLRDEPRPRAMEVGALVATFRVLEVRERRLVVLALLRREDAHAQRPVDLGRHVRVGLREAPGGGLGAVMAELLDLWIGCRAQPSHETPDLPGLEPELDERPEVSALRRIHRLRLRSEERGV